MALEAIIPNYNDLNYMLHAAQTATQYSYHTGTTYCAPMLEKPQNFLGESSMCSPVLPPNLYAAANETPNRVVNLGVQAQGRKKRKKRQKACKNKEEAETQRMTHIVVERNRRKQMNEHLAVLRSLMPESYAQRGDQASIVGGAIEFVKELEHLVQSLEAQKQQCLQRTKITSSETSSPDSALLASSFAGFFSDPQIAFSQVPNKYTLKSKAEVAEIEVTLIETHANIRIISRKLPRQLTRLVSGFQVLHLSILHLNVTSLDPLVLYSISVKVEEGCQLSCVDNIAEAVHHMLRLIAEDDAAASLF